jgi:hypothetical protein
VKKTTIIAAFPSSPARELRFAEALAREAQRMGRSVVLASALPPESVSVATSEILAKSESVARKKSPSEKLKAKAGTKAPGNEKKSQERILVKEETPAASLPAPSRDGILRLQLRPGSSLSARSVFLESSNALGQASELVLSLEPGQAARGLFASSPEEAEAFADERVKACFQLLREAGQRFSKLPGSSIAIALPGPTPPSGFAKLEREFFRSLGGACMAEKAMGGRIFGLSGDSSRAEEFAKALFRLLDDPKARGAGKWSPVKGGFLGKY